MSVGSKRHAIVAAPASHSHAEHIRKHAQTRYTLTNKEPDWDEAADNPFTAVAQC